MSDTEATFEEWALLELMGHRRLAGKVTAVQIAVASFLRIDIPGPGGDVATQYYSPGSVYALTPITEEMARRFAKDHKPAPITRWELAEIEQESHHHEEDVDDDSWEDL